MSKYLVEIDLANFEEDLPGLPEFTTIMEDFFDGKIKAGVAAKKLNLSRELFQGNICGLVILAIRDGKCNRVAEP